MAYDTTKPYSGSIRRLIEKTWTTPHLTIDNGIVNWNGSVRLANAVFHTDGFGTKGVPHWLQRTFEHAVYDTFAMNANDLAVMGAVPHLVTDHILLPEDDHAAIIDIVSYLAVLCKNHNVAIAGGETAIHNNLHGLEISLMMMGTVVSPRPNKFRPGDVLIGVESFGLHANGFTKAREKLGDDLRPELTRPTALYLGRVLAVGKMCNFSGMAHITGGGFTRLKSLLGDADAHIDRAHFLDPQDIFYELYLYGISDEEMYKTFNCGIGFIVAVPPDQAEKCLAIFGMEFSADIIGHVTPGIGMVIIESKFSSAKVAY